MMRRYLIVATAVLIVLALASRPVAADGAWLDRPATQWSTPGMAIPQAPPRDPAADQRCFDAIVVPDTAAKQALVAAGWFLFGTQVAVSGVEIISGQSSADGMCRPTGYQTFVFVDGTFAGTLSPGLMHSRDDGALVEAMPVEGNRVTASYVRYTDRDPLCCPSARTTARFEIVREGGVPVVLYRSSGTVPTGAPTVVPSPAVPPVQLPRGQ
jgi:hypothetical protein